MMGLIRRCATASLVVGAIHLGGCAAGQISSMGSADSTADHLEPGLQGQAMPGEARVLQQPYSKGVEVVGHSPVWNRDTNLQLSWVDHCAYISSTSSNFLYWGKTAEPSSYGVAVIDVSDPTAPKQVKLLRDRGSIYASETMNARGASGHKVLVAGEYGAKDDAAWLDVYDVSDCASPQLMAEVKWPENVHTVMLSANGKRVYGTHLDPFHGKGGIDVMDISDLAHPKYLGRFEATRPDGTSFEFAPHEVSISPDEKRIYAGVIASTGDDLNKGIQIFPPNREGLGPDAGGIYIFDNSDIAEGRPDPKMRLIGTAQHGGWHSVMPAHFKGVPYLVGGGELGACPGAWPRFVNIADETKPVVTGEFRLAMNRPENCPPMSPSEKASGGISPDPGTATLHFNDIDSADDTKLGLFNFMWAGLRIVDLRDPAHAIEVAYFRPGDGCGGHVRYMPKTGEIWLACAASGFYVLKLKPEVREKLGLPKIRG